MTKGEFCQKAIIFAKYFTKNTESRQQVLRMFEVDFVLQFREDSMESVGKYKGTWKQ